MLGDCYLKWICCSFSRFCINSVWTFLISLFVHYWRDSSSKLCWKGLFKRRSQGLFFSVLQHDKLENVFPSLFLLPSLSSVTKTWSVCAWALEEDDKVAGHSQTCQDRLFPHFWPLTEPPQVSAEVSKIDPCPSLFTLYISLFTFLPFFALLWQFAVSCRLNLKRKFIRAVGL